ncbi:hypothetical protein llap_6643 [Limosa lapponica baueri]|uniref:Uncharacterized protein n=1 Tax=Limosa lapponica baueri TaxID=1758121 RepID=A0A2I0UAL8_LIMLA|nr:hypothetical protein llap_6643 [Limosa lapponica baueri]
MLSIASAKIPALGRVLFPKADNEEGNHSSFHLPGHLYSRGTALPELSGQRMPRTDGSDPLHALVPGVWVLLKEKRYLQGKKQSLAQELLRGNGYTIDLCPSVWTSVHGQRQHRQQKILSSRSYLKSLAQYRILRFGSSRFQLDFLGTDGASYQPTSPDFVISRRTEVIISSNLVVELIVRDVEVCQLLHSSVNLLPKESLHAGSWHRSMSCASVLRSRAGSNIRAGDSTLTAKWKLSKVGEMSLCLKQGTISILPFPDSSRQRSFGRVIDPHTKKTENLSYEEKEQNGDSSLILMCFLLTNISFGFGSPFWAENNVTTPGSRNLNPGSRSKGKECKFPVPDNGRISALLLLILLHT